MAFLIRIGIIWNLFFQIFAGLDSIDQAVILGINKFLPTWIFKLKFSSKQSWLLGKPIVTCSTKWVTFSFETSVPFQGKVFVEDMAFDSRCSAQYISNLAKNATFRFPLRPCAKNSNLDTGANIFVSNVMVNFHPVRKRHHFNLISFF